MCKTYLYAKYKTLPVYVHRLEPTSIAQIFKSSKETHIFFPHHGLFFNDFALGYCYNLHK